jgi:hypothetical protein
MLRLPNEVFLSHSHLDREFANTLAEIMGPHGIPRWYSNRNILGAQQGHDEIGAALKRCDWFVVPTFSTVSRIDLGEARTSIRVERSSLCRKDHSRPYISPAIASSCHGRSTYYRWWTSRLVLRTDVERYFEFGESDIGPHSKMGRSWQKFKTQ